MLHILHNFYMKRYIKFLQNLNILQILASVYVFLNYILIYKLFLHIDIRMERQRHRRAFQCGCTASCFQVPDCIFYDEKNQVDVSVLDYKI